ncbi:MAG: hypothetical protein RL095_3566 [Verrucomicrobiota bacterium]|jgi:undecaprenyl diphosphate synthase
MSSSPQPIPQHVAIIMDGNGRWAKARGEERIFGHAAGVAAVIRSVEAALSHGVRVLTLYSFSTENWKRPDSEVSGLMSLFVEVIRGHVDLFRQQGVRLRFIGRRDRLPPALLETMDWILAETASFDRLTLVIALDYGGRDELARAARQLAIEVKSGLLDATAIDENLISASLDTAGLPDPELMIRSSGELRTSNFLPWQLAYAEIVVTPTLWPDFGEADFRAALEEFRQRQRRFGGL